MFVYTGTIQQYDRADISYMSSCSLPYFARLTTRIRWTCADGRVATAGSAHRAAVSGGGFAGLAWNPRVHVNVPLWPLSAAATAARLVVYEVSLPAACSLELIDCCDAAPTKPLLLLHCHSLLVKIIFGRSEFSSKRPRGNRKPLA